MAAEEQKKEFEKLSAFIAEGPTANYDFKTDLQSACRYFFGPVFFRALL